MGLVLALLPGQQSTGGPAVLWLMILRRHLWFLLAKYYFWL